MEAELKSDREILSPPEPLGEEMLPGPAPTAPVLTVEQHPLEEATPAGLWAWGGPEVAFGRRWALTRDDMASTGKVLSITRINECNSISCG